MRTACERAEQIREDLVHLASISRCVRTYSVDNGLDKVPELASQLGLKVFLGIWIGNNRIKRSARNSLGAFHSGAGGEVSSAGQAGLCRLHRELVPELPGE